MRILLRHAAVLGAAALTLALASPASADTTVITAADIPGTFTVSDQTGTSNFQFRAGPTTPPAGAGSLELMTPDTADNIRIGTEAINGTPLTAITSLSYYTYKSAPTDPADTAAPAIKLAIDLDGSGDWRQLIFEPYRNGTVAADSWQHWDTIDSGAGLWWSTRVMPGLPTPQTAASWSDIVAANPAAIVFAAGPSLGIGQGSANPGLVAAVDMLECNGKVFDFELTAPATAAPTPVASGTGAGLAATGPRSVWLLGAAFFLVVAGTAALWRVRRAQ